SLPFRRQGLRRPRQGACLAQEVLAMSTSPPPPTISGTIRLHVTPSSPLGADEAAKLRAIVEHFFEALRLRALPGTMGTVHALDQKPPGALDARFDVLEVELGSFRVLHGMLEGFSLLVAPLRTAIAWREPAAKEATVDLLGATAPL